MALLGFNLPRMSDSNRGENKEITEIKDYLYQLTDQLRYVLQNIDEDNFNDGFSDVLSEEMRQSLNATDSQVRGIASSVSNLANNIAEVENTLSDEIDALSDEIDGVRALIPQIESGTATAAATVDITFAKEYTAIPYVGINAVGLTATLTAVTLTGATVTVTDETIPDGSIITWVAIGG